jgi:hypothetical protein
MIALGPKKVKCSGEEMLVEFKLAVDTWLMDSLDFCMVVYNILSRMIHG